MSEGEPDPRQAADSSSSPLEGEVARPCEPEGGETLQGKGSPPPPTRRVQSHAATSPSRGEVKIQARGRGLSSYLRLALSVALLAAVAFGVWYFALRGPKDDPGRFQGEWQLAVPAADRDGQPAAWLKPVTVRVAGDKWVYFADGEETKRYQITLRPEANPKEIDLVQLLPDDTPLMQQWPPPARPVTIRGVYEIEGDRAKVVTNIGSEDRPKSLDAAEGETVWLLERVD